MRLIDADELTELVHWDFDRPPYSRKKVLNMIDMARTIDAVPVKHGKWTANGACSRCGFQPWYERDIHTLNYCPNCGARMDEE